MNQLHFVYDIKYTLLYGTTCGDMKRGNAPALLPTSFGVLGVEPVVEASTSSLLLATSFGVLAIGYVGLSINQSITVIS